MPFPYERPIANKNNPNVRKKPFSRIFKLFFGYTLPDTPKLDNNEFISEINDVAKYIVGNKNINQKNYIINLKS